MDKTDKMRIPTFILKDGLPGSLEEYCPSSNGTFKEL